MGLTTTGATTSKSHSKNITEKLSSALGWHSDWGIFSGFFDVLMIRKYRDFLLPGDFGVFMMCLKYSQKHWRHGLIKVIFGLVPGETHCIRSFFLKNRSCGPFLASINMYIYIYIYVIFEGWILFLEGIFSILTKRSSIRS